MSEDVIVVRTFNNETEAAMAQDLLKQSGLRSFVFKDDAGGMEPQLQRTGGVRLVVHREDAELANEILQTPETS